MEKAHILEEIRRCAGENDGRPLGRARFEAATGIRESDWSGKFWTRWSDAIREAGLVPNGFNQSLDDEMLLSTFAQLIAELGHFPTQAEKRLKATETPGFPNPKTFDRLGNKADLAGRLVDYCDRTPGLDAIREICRPLASDPEPTAEPGMSKELPGFVYLMKSGRFYKIGRSNSVGRREYELAIQLPEALEVVHAIETDDAPGIERYWHQRFSDRRANGEWFALTAGDVRAFKLRKRFM